MVTLLDHDNYYSNLPRLNLRNAPATERRLVLTVSLVLLCTVDVAPDGWWDEDDLESREVVAPADSTSTEDSTVN